MKDIQKTEVNENRNLKVVREISFYCTWPKELVIQDKIKVIRNSEAMRKTTEQKLFNKNTLCLIVIEQNGQNHDK